MIDGTDEGGITSTVSWKGGGDYEMVHVSPRFGSQTPRHRAPALKKKLGLSQAADVRDAV
ncbi:hypothetical protein [Brachybacterium saurashtrense]|uniref:hypothetical protein n=1 Tax=Brachybacterium saurashtrense TaxID=556288 RepID=UPI000F8CC056|nr:hypothetical protein [Brachybacterium saurashtrense]